MKFCRNNTGFGISALVLGKILKIGFFKRSNGENKKPNRATGYETRCGAGRWVRLRETPTPQSCLAKQRAKMRCGDNDTCAGCTSQSRAPRHKHGGRWDSYEAVCRLPPGAPLRNSFHGERHFCPST